MHCRSRNTGVQPAPDEIIDDIGDEDVDEIGDGLGPHQSRHPVEGVEQEQQGNVETQLPDECQPEGHAALLHRLHEMYHVEAQEHHRSGKAPGLQDLGPVSYRLRIMDEGPDQVGGKDAVENHADEGDDESRGARPAEEGVPPLPVAGGVVEGHERRHAETDADPHI